MLYRALDSSAIFIICVNCFLSSTIKTPLPYEPLKVFTIIGYLILSSTNFTLMGCFTNIVFGTGKDDLPNICCEYNLSLTLSIASLPLIIVTPNCSKCLMIALMKYVVPLPVLGNTKSGSLLGSPPTIIDFLSSLSTKISTSCGLTTRTLISLDSNSSTSLWTSWFSPNDFLCIIQPFIL